jgi:hypothetical protein
VIAVLLFEFRDQKQGVQLGHDHRDDEGIDKDRAEATQCCPVRALTLVGEVRCDADS